MLVVAVGTQVAAGSSVKSRILGHIPGDAQAAVEVARESQHGSSRRGINSTGVH